MCHEIEVIEPRVRVRPAVETEVNALFPPIDEIIGPIDDTIDNMERILREAIEAERQRIRAATPIGGYYFEFDSWETSNLHWVAPSSSPSGQTATWNSSSVDCLISSR